ncbi:MAG TPA: hypothetical protein VKV34_11435 [Thermoleophilia bacterium]|nr:hypothetical protein [Thermoleophilia bacterium]
MVSGTGVGVAATVSRGDHVAAPTTASASCPKFPGAPPLVLDLPGNGPRSTSDSVIAKYARSRLPADDPRVLVADVVVNYPKAGAPATIAALRRLPQHQAVVVTNLGLTELWSGRCEQAFTTLKAARSLDPYGYYGTRADNALHPGQRDGYPFYLPPVTPPKRTLSQLRAAVAASPRSPGPLLALAYAIQLADRSAAITAARAALRLDPHGVDPQAAVAVLTYNKESPQAAISALQTLAADHPNNPEASFDLGLVETWDCDTHDAEAQFAQIVRADARSVYSAFAKSLQTNERACPF